MPKKKVKEAAYPFTIDTVTFSQDAHCCSDNQERETLRVHFHDGGGGCFYVFQTEEFAFDADNKEHDKLIEKLKEICSSNDVHEKKEFDEYVRREDSKKQVKEEIEEKFDEPDDKEIDPGAIMDELESEVEDDIKEEMRMPQLSDDFGDLFPDKRDYQKPEKKEKKVKLPEGKVTCIPFNTL